MLAIVVYWKLKNLLLLGSVNGISMKPFTSCKLSLPESYGEQHFIVVWRSSCGNGIMEHFGRLS